MTESIRSAILNNVQGVEACVVYKNDNDTPDETGRWAHSVEVVVEGGDDYAIATQIDDKKAAGINTYGNVRVDYPTEAGDEYIIRFNRPAYVYVWFSVELSVIQGQQLVTNYANIIRNSILSQMEVLPIGGVMIPQEFIADIFNKVSGIWHVEPKVYYTDDIAYSPDNADYAVQTVPVSVRQRAITDATRIEVVINA
jgi:hypothetical protein